MFNYFPESPLKSRIYMYIEIRLLVMDYIEGIIDLAKNKKTYERNKLIEFIYFFFIKNGEDFFKKRNTIDYFKNTIFAYYCYNLSIFLAMKKQDFSANNNFTKKIIVKTGEYFFTDVVEFAMKKSILIFKTTFTYDEIVDTLKQMIKLTFEYKNVCMSYDTRIFDNYTPVRTCIKDMRRRTKRFKSKYTILYFYCAIFKQKEKPKNDSENTLFETLKIKEIFLCGKRITDSPFFYIQILFAKKNIKSR